MSESRTGRQRDIQSHSSALLDADGARGGAACHCQTLAPPCGYYTMPSHVPSSHRPSDRGGQRNTAPCIPN